MAGEDDQGGQARDDPGPVAQAEVQQGVEVGAVFGVGGGAAGVQALRGVAGAVDGAVGPPEHADGQHEGAEGHQGRGGVERGDEGADRFPREERLAGQVGGGRGRGGVGGVEALQLGPQVAEAVDVLVVDRHPGDQVGAEEREAALNHIIECII